jgi:hypothetical protein
MRCGSRACAPFRCRSRALPPPKKKAQTRARGLCQSPNWPPYLHCTSRGALQLCTCAASAPASPPLPIAAPSGVPRTHPPSPAPVRTARGASPRLVGALSFSSRRPGSPAPSPEETASDISASFCSARAAGVLGGGGGHCGWRPQPLQDRSAMGGDATAADAAPAAARHAAGAGAPSPALRLGRRRGILPKRGCEGASGAPPRLAACRGALGSSLPGPWDAKSAGYTGHAAPWALAGSRPGRASAACRPATCRAGPRWQHAGNCGRAAPPVARARRRRVRAPGPASSREASGAGGIACVCSRPGQPTQIDRHRSARGGAPGSAAPH